MRNGRTRRAWAVLLGCVLALAAAIAPGASADRDDDRGDGLVRKVDRMTLEEKVGQMFMTYAYGTERRPGRCRATGPRTASTASAS